MLTALAVQRHVDEFSRIRDDWLEILNRNPDSVDAAQHIVNVNAKLELLRLLLILR